MLAVGSSHALIPSPHWQRMHRISSMYVNSIRSQDFRVLPDICKECDHSSVQTRNNLQTSRSCQLEDSFASQRFFRSVEAKQIPPFGRIVHIKITVEVLLSQSACQRVGARSSQQA